MIDRELVVMVMWILAAMILGLATGVAGSIMEMLACGAVGMASWHGWTYKEVSRLGLEES